MFREQEIKSSDSIHLQASLNRSWNSSMEIGVRATKESGETGERTYCCHGPSSILLCESHAEQHLHFAQLILLSSANRPAYPRQRSPRDYSSASTSLRPSPNRRIVFRLSSPKRRLKRKDISSLVVDAPTDFATITASFSLRFENSSRVLRCDWRRRDENMSTRIKQINSSLRSNKNFSLKPTSARTAT